jgi:ribosome maturation factor RimP
MYLLLIGGIVVKKESLSKVRDLLYPIMEQYGFELVDVEYVKERRDTFLRVFIDKEGGVLIDDCQRVSEALSERLDEEDFIQEQYFLEVSSPGLDRPLKTPRDFQKNQGKEVEVKLYEPLHNSKLYIGVLQGLQDETLLLTDTEGNDYAFPMKSVAVVKRVVKF